jgi:hypothetical protein
VSRTGHQGALPLLCLCAGREDKDRASRLYLMDFGPLRPEVSLRASGRADPGHGHDAWRSSGAPELVDACGRNQGSAPTGRTRGYPGWPVTGTLAVPSCSAPLLPALPNRPLARFPRWHICSSLVMNSQISLSMTRCDDIAAKRRCSLRGWRLITGLSVSGDRHAPAVGR